MKKPSAAAKKAKAQELFTLSHKLLDAAKQLSEHHAAELRYNMQQAMEAAKTAAQKDMTKLQAMQKKAAADAAKRMSVYQKKVKAILKDIGNEAADGAEKHFDRARDAISDWIKEADKKIAKKCDLFLIIGSRSSSNSQRLVEVAKKFGCKESILMHSDQKLPIEKIKNSNNIGVTSGASAPEILVENLIKEIKSIINIRVEEVITSVEKVSFKLPTMLIK